MAKTTKLAKRKETALPAVTNQVDEMFGGSAPQLPINAPLPQIKIMRESPQYEMPAGDMVKSFEGHIIYFCNANQYYSKKFGEGDAIPDCYSTDGIIPAGGTDLQKGPCRICPMNEYGSAAEGEGKACQNTIRLYVLVDGEVIPSVLKAPPSSLGKKDSLVRWLTNAPNIAAKAGVGVHYQPIKVNFSLHKKEFSSGMSASVIDLETLRVLSPADQNDKVRLQHLSSLYKDFMASYIKRISDDVAAEPISAGVADAGDGLPEDEPPI